MHPQFFGESTALGVLGHDGREDAGCARFFPREGEQLATAFDHHSLSPMVLVQDVPEFEYALVLGVPTKADSSDGAIWLAFETDRIAEFVIEVLRGRDLIEKEVRVDLRGVSIPGHERGDRRIARVLVDRFDIRRFPPAEHQTLCLDNRRAPLDVG